MSAALTSRQLEFLSLTAQGMQRTQIAKHCFVAPATVSTTLALTRQRLGARTLPQAIAIAIRSDLLVLGPDGITFVANDSLAP